MRSHIPKEVIAGSARAGTWSAFGLSVQHPWIIEGMLQMFSCSHYIDRRKEPMNTRTEGNMNVPDVFAVELTIKTHFPGLWPAVDVGLSVCATLLLEDNVNPVAVIYVGDAATGKTTVAHMFADHPLTYVTDNFTPASFVSDAANVSRKDLEEVDLLPRIKHRVLITPEMAPVFRGRDDELATRFAILTRVLDGQGFQTDSGTHGQLGSRLFFPAIDRQEEVTIEDLVDSDEELSYKERLSQCKATVSQFLTTLQQQGVRSIPWESTADTRPLREWIACLAKVLAAMRSEPVKESDPGGDMLEYRPPRQEQPHRAYAVFHNLARGHALVHGRSRLAYEDLALVAQVAVSSMPSKGALLFPALVQQKEMTVSQVQAALGVQHHTTAQKVMEDLAGRGVMEYIKGAPGRAALLRFRDDWAWCTSPEFRAILLG